MEGLFINSYTTVGKGKTNKGKPVNVYVYTVTGTDAEMLAFEEIQTKAGAFQTDEVSGDPIWWNTSPVGNSPTLFITRKGAIRADLTEYNALIDLANKHEGTPTGNALAQRAADQIITGLAVTKRKRVVVDPQEVPETAKPL